MNNSYAIKTQKAKYGKGKLREYLLLGLLAVVLIFTAWKIFHGKDDTSKTATQMTETEKKISRLLAEIDGVGDAEVVVCETEEGITGAVVVCEGANDFAVVIDVREAVATALGTETSAIKIYLKK